MTRPARILPFAFEDFAPKLAPRAPEMRAATPVVVPEPRLTQSDIEAAFADGLAAGRVDGAGAAATTIGEQAREILDRISDENAQRSTALEHDRAALRAALRQFLGAFCERLAASNAAPLALALVDRLLAASGDSAPATLFVSEETFAAFGGRWHEELDSRPDAGFLQVGSDAGLRGGECRIQWRGGAAAYSHETVTAEIDRILAAASAGDPEDRL